MGLRETVEKPVMERTSFDIEFDVYDHENPPHLVLNISDIQVFVYVEGAVDPPVYINDRDGTDDTGVSESGGHVSFHMYPDDNQLNDDSLSNTIEKHVVRIVVKYNSDVDQDVFEWVLKIKNLKAR